jgi:hypothetical protein
VHPLSATANQKKIEKRKNENHENEDEKENDDVGGQCQIG